MLASTLAPLYDPAPELDRIEATRRVHGISRLAVCRQAGIAPSTWRRWKSGITSPNSSTLARLSVALSALITAAGRSSQGEGAERPIADAPLLALAPELEAAATLYLAYDRDQHTTSADPDHIEAHATSRALWDSVEAVTECILAHQPTTLPGLLLVAHAAAVAAEDTWDQHPDNGGKVGRLLRLVCNGLFRLAGVDWRGREIADAKPPATPAPAPAPSPDGPLIPLAEAALAEERAAHARAAAAGDVRPGNFARSLHLLELVTEQDAHTPAGLAAKARVLLAHASEVEELDGDWRCEALSLSIARDAVRLGAPAQAVPYAMAAE